MSEGLLVIQQGTGKENRRGRQKKIWDDIIKKWTWVDFASLKVGSCPNNDKSVQFLFSSYSV